MLTPIRVFPKYRSHGWWQAKQTHFKITFCVIYLVYITITCDTHISRPNCFKQKFPCLTQLCGSQPKVSKVWSIAFLEAEHQCSGHLISVSKHGKRTRSAVKIQTSPPMQSCILCTTKCIDLRCRPEVFVWNIVFFQANRHRILTKTCHVYTHRRLINFCNNQANQHWPSITGHSPK